MVVLLGWWITARRGSSNEFRGGKGMQWLVLVSDGGLLFFGIQADKEREASEWEGERYSIDPPHRRAGVSW